MRIFVVEVVVGGQQIVETYSVINYSAEFAFYSGKNHEKIEIIIFYRIKYDDNHRERILTMMFIKSDLIFCVLCRFSHMFCDF